MQTQILHLDASAELIFFTFSSSFSFVSPNPVLVPCWISLAEAQLTPPKTF